MEAVKSSEKRRWKLTTSQCQLLEEQFKIQQSQLQPFIELQAMARTLLLENFRHELEIPQGTPLEFDPKTFTLKEK